ncbi:MAG TPA: DUF4203 domain-containing protein [Clostridia bacterium]|nr:DUF4203 domain-containing protein [Clostridia bacterium]
MVINIVAILFGLIACFYGYKAFRVWLALAGLLFGARLGYYLGGFIGEQIWPIVGAIAVGLVICLLSYFLYKLGAVLIGALIGGMFTSIILSALGVTAQTWMLLVGAAVVAIIAGVFLKQFIIIGSSFQGSYLVVAGAYALISGMSYAGFNDALQAVELPWYLYLIIVVLGIVGMIVQNSNAKKAPPQVKA